MVTTVAEKREKSGVVPSSPPPKTSLSSSTVAQQKDAVALLRQLRDDVVFLDSRLNKMEDKNLQQKLKAMETEKDETEQVLSSLRGKLEEHKRLSQSKRKALKERRDGSAATPKSDGPSNNGNAHVRSSTPPVSREVVSSAPPASEIQQPTLKQDENNTLETSTEASQSKETKASARDLSDKEVQELEEKIKMLENQKDEMEQTLLELLRTYEDKTSVLQLEKERLEDDKASTYTEMKGLLVEQHQESERLRNKVTKLEHKRKNIVFAAKACFFILFMVIVSGGLWVAFAVEDPSTLYGNLNYLCAPARPGGAPVTEATGAAEAPWWAPSFTKAFVFPLVCEDRPRIRMEFKRGTLFITQQPGNVLVKKKFGHVARINDEADVIHISDHGGGYKEFKAPWSLATENRNA